MYSMNKNIKKNKKMKKLFMKNSMQDGKTQSFKK